MDGENLLVQTPRYRLPTYVLRQAPMADINTTADCLVKLEKKPFLTSMADLRLRGLNLEEILKAIPMGRSRINHGITITRFHPPHWDGLSYIIESWSTISHNALLTVSSTLPAPQVSMYSSACLGLFLIYL